MTSSLTAEVRIEDPTWYNHDAYATIARLHAELPVYFYEPLSMWILTKYEHIQRVGKNPAIFSNAHGLVLNDFRFGNITAQFFPKGAENFALADPPRHDDLRRILVPSFSARRVKTIEDEIRARCAAVLDGLEHGTAVDWSGRVAEFLTVQLFCALLGVPFEDRAKVAEWAKLVNRMSEAISADELLAAAGDLGPMGAYFQAKLEERFANPSDDVIGAVAAAVQDGRISIETAHMFVTGVMTAGNGNTVSTINGAMVAFAENPEQLARVREDPGRARNAAEELLRWLSPIRAFGRTIVADTDMFGVPMRSGQSVLNLYMAANRDPEVFPNPDAFDVDREFAKPAMSFGYGQHACIGAVLTRTVVRVVVEEFAARFGGVEVVAEESELDETSFLLNHPWRRLTAVLH
ncbi:cytochrome P450 [Pseudonocardia kujensis]|uniref:cytochrome P450 n=1 Tax=Pseudonocardia kujensis TaxID=1128675 RepID=UPI001E3B211B|nr:cytochrome P450 [Pseudonocardia kujensis]MCE0763497.1 cytochrome P450 [Pseudonocardia kujensis]